MILRFKRISLFNREWKKTKATEGDYENVKEEIIRIGEHADGHGAHLRSVKVGVKGSGKSGGIRVFYFARIKGFVFLITCYDRRKKDGLTDAEMKLADDLAKAIIEKYK